MQDNNVTNATINVLLVKIPNIVIANLNSYVNDKNWFYDEKKLLNVKFKYS